MGSLYSILNDITKINNGEIEQDDKSKREIVFYGNIVEEGLKTKFGEIIMEYFVGMKNNALMVLTDKKIKVAENPDIITDAKCAYNLIDDLIQQLNYLIEQGKIADKELENNREK